MGRNVAIGIQNFNEIIKNNCFYVDKTAFIKEWWDSGDSVTLIMRPRYFGKTLTMSMVEHFFSVGYAGRSDLFEGLSIWEEKKYREIQGTYPVISLSFANVKEKTYAETKCRICQLITELYNKNRFLLEGDLLTEADKKYFLSVTIDMPEVVATFSLHKLAGFLSQYYGKKVIILLDEYDTPMQEAYIDGYWDELVAFTRSLFNATFKTNPWLERAIMTRITRVSKESIFSDLNNLKVVTTTCNEYVDCFGFTESEVFGAMDEFGYDDKALVKQWYDGFIFGDKKDIYNPWSILNFLDTGTVKTYWAPADISLQVVDSRQMPASGRLARCQHENTRSNSLVGKLIREGIPEVKTVMEDLLSGKIFRTQIDEQIIFSQLDNRISAIWSLLLASGYLKVVNYKLPPEVGRPEYDLCLTNMEVRLMFEDMIRDWFSEYTPAYNQFIKALILDDVDAMNEYMNRVALETFSFFDTGARAYGQTEPERFYHGFVLGLIVDLRGRYVITSNRESGFGRYDVILEPLSAKDDAIIIEFKVRKKREKSIEETLQNALQQIEDKQYETELLAKGISKERIRKYGFAFEGKQVLIG